MRTALRKMGNSTGIILPRSILGQIGLELGAPMELQVEGGRIVATPVKGGAREDWASAAALIAAQADPDEDAWQSFGNAQDDDLTW
jgi:antitoxin MazE